MPTFSPEPPRRLSVRAWASALARKDDASKQLIDAVNASLVKLTKAGKIKELQMKWFGVSVDLPTDG